MLAELLKVVDERMLGLKFLITSRPEGSIRREFDKTSKTVVLRQESSGPKGASDDMSLYMRAQLRKFPNEAELQASTIQVMEACREGMGLQEIGSRSVAPA